MLRAFIQNPDVHIVFATDFLEYLYEQQSNFDHEGRF